MDQQVTVTEHESYVEYCFRGAIDDEKMYQYFRDLWSSTDYEPTRSELYDFRHADFSAVTSTAIKKILSLNRELHADAPQLPHAMLATEDFHYGLSRMIAALSEDRNPRVRVFRDPDEAVAWVSSERARSS